MDGRAYPMLDTDFPTVNPADPYALTPEEEILIHQLTLSFLHSEKLQRHVRFLYSKGSLYQISSTATCSSTAASPWRPTAPSSPSR